MLTKLTSGCSGGFGRHDRRSSLRWRSMWPQSRAGAMGVSAITRPAVVHTGNAPHSKRGRLFPQMPQKTEGVRAKMTTAFCFEGLRHVCGSGSESVRESPARSVIVWSASWTSSCPRST